jgi:hypothetical protein
LAQAAVDRLVLSRNARNIYVRAHRGRRGARKARRAVWLLLQLRIVCVAGEKDKTPVADFDDVLELRGLDVRAAERISEDLEVTDDRLSRGARGQTSLECVGGRRINERHRGQPKAGCRAVLRIDRPLGEARKRGDLIPLRVGDAHDGAAHVDPRGLRPNVELIRARVELVAEERDRRIRAREAHVELPAKEPGHGAARRRVQARPGRVRFWWNHDLLHVERAVVVRARCEQEAEGSRRHRGLRPKPIHRETSRNATEALASAPTKRTEATRAEPRNC